MRLTDHLHEMFCVNRGYIYGPVLSCDTPLHAFGPALSGDTPFRVYGSDFIK